MPGRRVGREEYRFGCPHFNGLRDFGSKEMLLERQITDLASGDFTGECGQSWDLMQHAFSNRVYVAGGSKQGEDREGKKVNYFDRTDDGGN